MDNVPGRAIYRCPIHGDFIAQVRDKNVLASEKCPVFVSGLGEITFCNNVSPMTTIDQILGDFRPSSSLTPELQDEVRETALKLKAARDAKHAARKQSENLAQGITPEPPKKTASEIAAELAMNEELEKFEREERMLMEITLAAWNTI